MSLALEGVHKHFGTHHALQEITQNFPSGSLTALVGPSGCGKTTLLRIIAGLERPDTGSIRLDGEDHTQAPLSQRQVGFVYQQYALFPHLTVAENIGFSLAVRKRDKAAIAARVAELLALVRLSGYERKLPRELSGGERQRTALARALASDPKLLLLDEPFAALDLHVRKSLRRWLRELHERTHITTILVTHDADEAMEIADHLVILRGGRVQQAGTPKSIYENPVSPFVMQFIGGANVLRLPSSPDDVYVRPRHIRVSAHEVAGAIAGIVDRIIDFGDHVHFEIRMPNEQRVVADLDAAHARESGVQRGGVAWITITHAHTFDTKKAGAAA
jgi:sulfate transport system ATP-binding protein